MSWAERKGGRPGLRQGRLACCRCDKAQVGWQGSLTLGRGPAQVGVGHSSQRGPGKGCPQRRGSRRECVH